MNWVELYNALRKYMVIATGSTFPVLLFINAPFGRFTPENSSWTVDGRVSWLIMEIVSPITFITTFIRSPLSPSPISITEHSGPQGWLAFFFVAHYLNRAILSPLTTPSRSRSHLIVPMSAVGFNLVNGFLMGSYVSSPLARTQTAYSTKLFLLGSGLWAFGLLGNIVHDEILLDLRRTNDRKKSNTSSQDQQKGGSTKQHYAIPYGHLYKYISYPNYFCEWLEWIGFALAASPGDFTTPPWIFVFAEIATMLPRALKGHRWYQEKFSDYPKERKAVIPFLL